MKNELKNIFLMGLGAASLTKKKATQAINAFVKKGIINNKQAQELLSRFMKEATKTKNKLKKEGKKEYTSLKKKVKRTETKVRKKVAKGMRGAAKRIVRKTLK